MHDDLMRLTCRLAWGDAGRKVPDICKGKILLTPKGLGAGRASSAHPSSREIGILVNWPPTIAGPPGENAASWAVGSRSRRQCFHSGWISCGRTSATRWPIAQVTT